MSNDNIPHDHHHHRLRPHHEEMDQLQLQAALAVKPQAVKRQVRRRTHTSRPYQERLLNMAEARREIVTALKIHRASSTTRQQQQQQSTHLHHQEPPPLQLQQQQQEEQKEHVQVAAPFQDRSKPAVIDEETSLAAHTTTMSYAAASNPLCNSPPAQHWISAGSYYWSSPPPILRLPCDLTPPELPPTAAMGGLVELEQYHGGLERLVRSLPAQPLGLNLSFQGFGVSVDDREDLFGLPLAQPSPAASYSPPPAVETATTHACAPSPALSATDAENYSVIDAPAAAALDVPALDGGEKMAQASTGGGMQGVECSEAAAAADVAAWWGKIFESVESASPDADDVSAASGLPAEWRWLCGDDVGLGEQAGAVTGCKPSPDVLGTMMTQHVDDGDGDRDYSCCCYEGDRSDDGEDVTLPCIGDDTQGWFSSS